MKSEDLDSDAMRLPKKDCVPFSKGCGDTDVLVNLFKMEVDPDLTIYKYRVDIKKIRKGKETDLTKGIKSDAGIQHRRRVCRSLLEDAFKKAEKDGHPWATNKYSYVYDCANILYSNELLKCINRDDKSMFVFNLSMEDVSSDFTHQFVGNQCEQIIVSIEPTLEFTYSMASNCDKHQETIQFLEVLTSAVLYKNGDHFVFKNKFYGKTSRNDVPIGEGKSIKPGFEKGVRLGETNGRPYAYLQLDAKKSPFFNGVSVLNFCMEYINARNPADLERIDNSSIRKLNSQLKNLVVRTTHTPKNKARYFHMTGLSDRRANDVEFDVNGERITLVDYYKTKYNVNLKHPKTHCIAEKSRQKLSLFPMETIEVERGQRVNCQKASKSMGEKQIKECRMNPPDMVDRIKRSLSECLLTSDNKYLQNFKVKVSSHMEYVPASMLYPPVIKYGNVSVEPNRDGMLNWRMGQRESFVKSGVIENMALIIFDNCVSDHDAGAFIDRLLRTSQEHGMRVPSARSVKFEYLRSEATENLEGLFRKMKELKGSYILAVTKQKFDDIHHTLKAFEAKHGVVTQHIWSQTMNKAIGNQGAYMVINNLVMKMNPKSHGVNHDISLSKAYLDANRNNVNANERVYSGNRMIIGFDVAHAGPQSFADRALGIQQSEPSIVGMSYSLTSYTQLAGRYWMQAPGAAGISKIADHMALSLNHYKTVVGKMPDDIVVYRGGVSEGEFDKVKMEVNEMKKAFTKKRGIGESQFCPSITCVVVMANSNFRVLPQKINPNDKPMNQNVWPGTVVHSTVTNPNYNEFLLVSQKGIMGTVRPTRCVIVVSERGSSGTTLSCDDVEQLTYGLAHGHQVVCASTTLPVPLTAATNLSKRGRNNWKEINFRDSDCRSALSGSSGDNGIFKNDGSEDFFDRMSEAVSSKLNHHYWA